jgi:hypothetical protein
LSIAIFTSSVTLSSNLGSILYSSIYLNKKTHNYKCPGRKEKLVKHKHKYLILMRTTRFWSNLNFARNWN